MRIWPENRLFSIWEAWKLFLGATKCFWDFLWLPQIQFGGYFRPYRVQIHLNAVSDQTWSECVRIPSESDFRDTEYRLNRSEFIDSRFHKNCAWKMYFLSRDFLGFTSNCLSSEIRRAQNRNRIHQQKFDSKLPQVGFDQLKLIRSKKEKNCAWKMYFLSPDFLGFTWNCLSSEIKRAQNRNMFGHFFLNSRQKRVSRWSRSDWCETV